jgi:phosphoribosylanthranilate isomerase
MTWIKICGITNLGDALAAADAGADAVGFVFYEKSPRRIAPDRAKEIIEQLPKKIEKVGVFVDLEQEDFPKIAEEVGLTTIQCRLRSQNRKSANGRGRFPRSLKMLMTLSATRLIENDSRLQALTADFLRIADSPKPPSGFDTFLLDSSAPEQPGGTGRTFEWQRIAPLVQVMNKSVKVVVAGGLTPENVTEAMRILRPWGVDVSSGVEAAPGRKDAEKVRAFVRAVRVVDGAAVRK